MCSLGPRTLSADPEFRFLENLVADAWRYPAQIRTSRVDAANVIVSNMERPISSRAGRLRTNNRGELMANLKAIHLAFFLVFFSSLNVFGMVPVNSGTTNNLNGAYLLDSARVSSWEMRARSENHRYRSDMGATASGTITALHDVYLFNPNEGVAVGDGGIIFRTTDGGAGWQSVASGVKDSLRSVFFSGVNGICGGDSQTILYSADSGASWQIGQTGFFGSVSRARIC